MQEVLDAVASFVWGPFLLIPILLVTGLYLTIALRGLQLRRLRYALWLALIRRREPGGRGEIPHYQALAVALASTVGVGNIAGVATAIYLGGPGALFSTRAFFASPDWADLLDEPDDPAGGPSDGTDLAGADRRLPASADADRRPVLSDS